MGEAKTATGIGNPDVGDDPGGDQDPGGAAGAVGAGVFEEAKGEGAPPAVLGAGHGAGRGDAEGVDGSSGSVVKPPEHGAEEAHPAGSHSTLGAPRESVAEGGNERHDQDSDEDAAALVAGTEIQEVVDTGVVGASSLGGDAPPSGSADTVETKAFPGVVQGASEDHDQRGADATEGGGGDRGGDRGGADDAVVDTDDRSKVQDADTEVARDSSVVVDAQSGRTDTASTEGSAEGTNEGHYHHSGSDAASLTGTETQKVVDADIADTASLDVGAQSGSAGSVSTKGSPDVAGASVREAAAAMRKRSDSISHNDATDTPARGFFVSRERHGQDDSEDATGADGTPASVGGGVELTGADSNMEGAARDTTAAREGGNPSADRVADDSGGAHEHAQPDAVTDNSPPGEIDANIPVIHAEEASNGGRTMGEGADAANGGGLAGEGSLGASVGEVPTMSDKGTVLATTADETAGKEDVGVEELVLPGGTAVLPGGDDAAAENPAIQAAGTSGGLEPDSGSEGSMKGDKEEAGGLPVGISAHSDMEEQPLAETPVRVTDDHEGLSPVTTDEQDRAAVGSVVDSSGVVAEAAAADALTAQDGNGRQNGVTPAPSEGVGPPVEGLEESITRDSQVLTSGIEDGSEHLADVDKVASPAGAPGTSSEVDAAVGEEDGVQPNDDVTVSGDASEPPDENVLEQAVHSADGAAGQGEGEAEKTEEEETSVAGPADLETPDGTDGSSMEDAVQAPGKLFNQSAPENPPGAASETPEELASPVPVTTGGQEGGGREEGTGTAAVSEANTNSAVSEQEGVGVGETQGEKVEGGSADENPVVAGSEAEADVAGASGGDGADVGAAAGVDVETGAAAAAAVSEEEGRRARSKAKLGLARLQKGQTKKALLMFEKAASIDPGWWGGFYYTALGERLLKYFFVAVCST